MARCTKSRPRQCYTPLHRTWKSPRPCNVHKSWGLQKCSAQCLRRHARASKLPDFGKKQTPLGGSAFSFSIWLGFFFFSNHEQLVYSVVGKKKKYFWVCIITSLILHIFWVWNSFSKTAWCPLNILCCFKHVAAACYRCLIDESNVIWRLHDKAPYLACLIASWQQAPLHWSN